MLKLSDIIEELREIFVTKDNLDLRLSPLEKSVYGVIAVILLAVVSTLVASVIKK